MKKEKQIPVCGIKMYRKNSAIKMYRKKRTEINVCFKKFISFRSEILGICTFPSKR